MKISDNESVDNNYITSKNPERKKKDKKHKKLKDEFNDIQNMTREEIARELKKYEEEVGQDLSQSQKDEQIDSTNVPAKKQPPKKGKCKFKMFTCFSFSLRATPTADRR